MCVVGVGGGEGGKGEMGGVRRETDGGVRPRRRGSEQQKRKKKEGIERRRNKE